MGKPRKRHLQLELPVCDKNGQRRGGKRRGAGRPAKGSRPSERHERRPKLRASQPVHVVMRVVPAIRELRRRKMHLALREALIVAFMREYFHIVHISIQANHVHLLVEARDRLALARGMQGFQISAAKHLNAAVRASGAPRRRGQVFADRYHATIIDSRRQARHCLAYVLNNWRHHREDRARSWTIDPFSSADAFAGWRELEDSAFLWRTRATYLSLPVWQPRTWLLAHGWRLYGSISAFEVPGERGAGMEG